jgi:hypothetical protein
MPDANSCISVGCQSKLTSPTVTWQPGSAPAAASAF